MPQRDSAPPDEWEPRRDSATRRAVQAIEDRLRGEITDTFREHLVESSKKHREMEERFVTYKAFALGIVVMLLSVYGFAREFMGPTKESVAAAAKKLGDATTTIE